MPRYNRYRPRNRRYRRYRRKAPIPVRDPAIVKVARTAYNGYRLARKLANAVNIEYKFSDTTANASPDQSGILYTLNDMAQGDSDSTRDGDSVKIQNLVIRGSMNKGASATNSWCRMLIFWDKDNLVTAATDILENYMGSATAPFAPKNHDRRFQTRVLYDKVFSLDASNSARNFEQVIKIDQHTNYNEGTTTIYRGALKLLFISNESVNYPFVQYIARISYTDN